MEIETDRNYQKPPGLFKKKFRCAKQFGRNLKSPRHLAELVIIFLIISYSSYLLYKFINEQVNYLGTYESNSKLGIYKHAAVSTDAYPCAKVGKDLLAKGGSAVDAIIGVMLCKGLVIPNSSGLGGGCFITVYNSTNRKATYIDGREEAPDYSSEHMFGDNAEIAARGPLSIAVPGELAAMWEAHQRYGRLSWSELFQPVIELAENGVPLVEHMSLALRKESHAKHISPLLKPFYTNNETGQYYELNDIVRYPVLAQTLRRIQANGVNEFYGGGETGRMFIEDLEAQGGHLTMNNLQSYKARFGDALSINLAPTLKLHAPLIPSSGIVLSIILRIMIKLGYYDIHRRNPEASYKQSVLFYHHLVEANKFAYAQRAGLEDQPDDPERLKQLVKRLLSDKFIDSIVSKIDDLSTHLPDYYGNEHFALDHGTAHVSAVDSYGNAASATTSVNLYFGSGLISPRTGILYNDVMDDFVSPEFSNKFNLAPSKYNRIRPGRRPMSSMSPSIFVDPSRSGKDHVRLVIGASGGSQITTSIALVALRTLFFKDDVKTAIDASRIHHQLYPNSILYEANFPAAILQSLGKDYKHHLQLIEGRSSVVMAIGSDTLDNGSTVWTANSDYRKGGAVDGF